MITKNTTPEYIFEIIKKNLMNLINSAAYEDIANHVILTQSDMQEYMRNYKLLKSDAIIYCKTDFSPLLFKHLAFSGRSYKIITHHSDYPIDQHRFNSKPSCIKKWYAINPTYKHPDLIPIPLGTKTPEGRAYHEPQYKIKWFEKNRERLFNSEKNTSRVYCNWGDTNPARNNIIKKLKVGYLQQSGLSFETYCEQMAQYKFVISPPGNGLDNHRTWEALYLGCIPIVIANPIYDSWQLPILQVKYFSEITDRILEEYLDRDCSYEMLDFEYWKKLIK